MPTDQELSASIDSAITSLNLSLNSKELSKEMFPSLTDLDLLKVKVPTIAEMFGLDISIPEVSVMPSLSTQATDGTVTLDEPNLPTGEALAKQDPHTIQHITKYVVDTAAISRTEINTGKTEYIKKLATLIKQNQNVNGADKNLFLLTGNSGLTNSGNNYFNLEGDYIYDILSTVTVNAKSDLLFNGGDFFKNPIYNASGLKNGLTVVQPKYIGKSIPNPTLDIKTDDGRIITNFGTFDLFRFADVNNVAKNINIKAIDSKGKLIGSDITIKSEGKQINISGLSYTADALFDNIITPASQVTSIIKSGDTVKFDDTVPTTNPQGQFNINAADEPGPGAFKTFEVEASKSNMLAKHLEGSLISEKNKTFIETQIGIIRSGEEISINRPKNTISEGELSTENELPAKLEIIPKYYTDKEVITYKKEAGKSTGEIEKIKYITPTIVFNADADDNNTRYDPYGTTGAETNKQLNFDESQAITTVKKSDFYTKIANKWDILFHENYGGTKPDPSKLDFGMGKILVIRNASESADADGNWIYNIPFQFTPELSGESRSANWSTHTALGRTNDYFIWSNTASRTMQLRTSYAVIAPESNDPAWFKDGRNGNAINSIYGEWGKYWTETIISGILAKYRKLVLPENYTPNTSLSDGNRLSPPIIIISFGTDADTKFSDSAVGKTRWLVSDINIDTKLEAGWTSAKNPRMYDISLTLKEVAPSWRSYQTHAQF